MRRSGVRFPSAPPSRHISICFHTEFRVSKQWPTIQPTNRSAWHMRAAIRRRPGSVLLLSRLPENEAAEAAFAHTFGKRGAARLSAQRSIGKLTELLDNGRRGPQMTQRLCRLVLPQPRRYDSDRRTILRDRMFGNLLEHLAAADGSARADGHADLREMAPTSISSAGTAH
jgi:hypothetical protein